MRVVAQLGILGGLEWGVRWWIGGILGGEGLSSFVGSSSGGGRGNTVEWDWNGYLLPEEKTPIAFAFMMCLAVGLAVFCLASFHLYLVLSAQTTIEFHGNVSKRRKGGWKNPYSAGSRWRNWEMIYGTGCVDENDRNDRRNRGFWGVILAMMPSSREPEFLPIPVDGKLLRRKNGGDVADKKEDVELGFPRRSNVNLDEESDHSASNGTNGLKERAVRRSPEAAEMIV